MSVFVGTKRDMDERTSLTVKIGFLSGPGAMID